MPGVEGGQKVNLSRFALLLTCAGLCPAQVFRQGDIEIIPMVSGIPCEPGEPVGLQLGIFPCPPVEKQGLMIHVRSDDWWDGTHESYLITVTYRTTAGETKTVTCGGDNPCPKRKRDFGQDWDAGWRAIAFQIGRVATEVLPGITIQSVSVAKVPPPSAIIPIGTIKIGPP